MAVSGRMEAVSDTPAPRARGWTRRLIAAAVVVGLAGCAQPTAVAPAATAPPSEIARSDTAEVPANVGKAKLAATAYHESGAYMRAFALAAAPASEWLRQRAPQVTRPAMVFDIDDTALTNWPVIVANDFGRFAPGPCLIPDGPCGWHDWDLLGRDEALVPTLEVFRTARSLDVAVFFISGRPENERAATERNLRTAGYTGYVQAFFTPNGAHYAALADFKAPVRAKIAGMGYTIIANMGDQYSDLEGGYAEKTFKLPNPFYYIP